MSALAFGIEISFSACVALVPLVWLITLLPVSIGGIGLREASFALLLGTVGIGTEESLLISLGTYAALLVSGAVGGNSPDSRWHSTPLFWADEASGLGWIHPRPSQNPTT